MNIKSKPANSAGIHLGRKEKGSVILQPTEVQSNPFQAIDVLRRRTHIYRHACFPSSLAAFQRESGLWSIDFFLFFFFLFSEMEVDAVKSLKTSILEWVLLFHHMAN
jgi:hypothetical protein